MDERSAQAMAVAMSWVAKIFATAVVMAVPAIAGSYLDRWWGVGFLSPAGVVFGAVAGFVYLIAITRTASDADASTVNARRAPQSQGPSQPAAPSPPDGVPNDVPNRDA
ncbi:MAG: hypothetical protein KF847_11685 [Pirellulales bacterium]|nr:hypothetical protein [Pirellulales bacterium]